MSVHSTHESIGSRSESAPATPAYEGETDEQKSKAEQENTATRLSIPASETADGKEKTLTTEELRQGHTGDHVRHILYLSTIGAVIGLILIYAAATV
ncbi:MAG: hypothetical protein MRY59_07460 [Aquisalinus sp.]|nr:hypothetical protein [Aquisalinus sp.]